jgi:uncharacterized damage-inducible protein DinB
MLLPYFRRLALYNQWANARLYAACADLPEADRKAARQAFFGSIHRTLNHILVADRLWMGRILGAPESLALDEELYGDLASLRAARQALDRLMIEHADGLDDAGLDGDLVYKTTRGEPSVTPLRHVYWHMFNHQTHHRGQVHDLLTQTSVAPPPLDLIYFLREAA